MISTKIKPIIYLTKEKNLEVIISDEVKKLFKQINFRFLIKEISFDVAYDLIKQEFEMCQWEGEFFNITDFIIYLNIFNQKIIKEFFVNK